MRKPFSILAGALLTAFIGSAALAQTNNPGNKAAVGTGVTGTITIKAVQMTPGGPAVGADPVQISFFDAHGRVVGSSQSQLNDKGELKIDGIRLNSAFQPIVIVTHAGVKYQGTGTVMNAAATQQNIDVNVYEPTSQDPGLDVRMRHIMVEPSPVGLSITEMISIMNPGDRAFIGKPSGAGNRMVAFSLPLPPNARNIQVSDEGVVGSGKAMWRQPITPGATEITLKYMIPAEQGNAEVVLSAPAPTKSLLVFLPDDGTGFVSEKFKKMTPKPGANLRENSRFFTADPLNAGDQISFMVTNLANAKPVAMTAGPVTVEQAGLPKVLKVVGGVGIILIVLIGVLVILVKAKKTA